MVGHPARFSANGGEASGYLALPPSNQGPGIVVVQEWWGLVPHIKDLCDRFAQNGFLALAPDLYHGKTTVEAEEANHLLQNLDWGRATIEITGAVRHLRGQGCPKVGVVGFCMGGALSMIAAAKAGVDAAVSFYGFPPQGPPRGQTCPPSLVLFGENENFFPVPDAKAWVEEQKKAGVDSDIVIYPGAGHAFFNDQRPEAYHAMAAKDAWNRTLRHFRKHLTSAG
jgi:carboxymethylenebutenolidase